jgi:hypothetical protein
MIVHNRTRHMFHGAALSALLLLAAAPAALADPPGYLFQDFAPPMPGVASVLPHQIDPASRPAASPSVAGPDRAPSPSDHAQLQGGQRVIR